MTLFSKLPFITAKNNKSALFLLAALTPFLATARDGNLLEAAVIGGAQGTIIGVAAIIYFMVWKPFKSWLGKRNTIKQIEKQQLTALMLAAAEGDDLEVEKLIQQGRDVNEAGKSGETALMLAAKNDKRSTVRLLLVNGANPNAMTTKGNTARDIAKKQGHAYSVDILVDAETVTH